MREIIPRSIESNSVEVGGLFSPDSDPIAYAKHIDAAADALFEDFLHDVCMSKAWFDVGTKTYIEPSEALRKSVCKGASAVPVTQDKPKADADLRASYMNWLQSWRVYYNDNINVTFPSPERDDLNKWYAQLQGYYDKFQATGAKSTTPPLISPEKAAGMTPKSDLSATLDKLATLAVIGLVAYAGVKIMSKTPTPSPSKA